MAKVVIWKGTARIEADLSVAELKELAGLNGQFARDRAAKGTGQSPLPLDINYKAFFDALSDQGRSFLRLLKAAGQKGISAENVARDLHLTNRYSVGGLTGGGIGKQVNRFGIDRNDVYTKEDKPENGVRTVIFRAGKILDYLE